MKTLFIIDASGYIYRSYHAIAPMTNSAGQSTNALFGFIRSLQKLSKEFPVDHIVSVFDGPNNAQKREAIYSEYKATRKETPRDLPPQIQLARQYCDLAGIPKLVVPGYEADDIMGSVARWAADLGYKVYLCTSDKDMAQIVDDKIHLLNTHKENLVIDPAGVVEKFGVRPDQIVDWLAMTGDASDNVPGIPGFGPKTASSLLQEFGTLDAILDNPEKVKGEKKQQLLRTERESALMSRELVRLHIDGHFPREEQFYQLQSPKVEPLKEFYHQMNFNSLLKELSSRPVEPDQKQSNSAPVVGSSYHLVDDPEALEQLLKMLSNETEVCFDTETTAIHPLEAELVGIGFCVQPGTAWYVPLNGKLGQQKVLDGIRPLFTNPKIGFYCHNAKYDLHVMHKAGIVVASVGFDTMLASYILHSHSRQHSLDKLSLDLFGKVKIATEELIGKGKKQITMAEVPIQQVSDYCCEDVDYTSRLKEVFKPELKERNLENLYYQLELPLMRVLERMDWHGIYLDTAELALLSHHLDNALELLERDIYTLAGEEFNIKSPKQLSQILFEKMGIKPPKKTATGFSTNADVLEDLQDEYPIAKKIIEFRTLEKLRSTYTEVLPTQVNKATGRIHCSFNQSVAATGRLSSQDPNLQNIPVRTELGRQIRKAFKPQKQGWSFISADYSQIELRLVAHLSGDPKLVEAFRNGADIHKVTAAEVMGIPLDQVTSEQRYHAKAVNFGIIYGQQAFGLSRETGIPVKQAQQFIEKYFERYSKVKEFIERCKEKARQTGKSVTLNGREREIPEINSKNPQLRALAERLAVNTPLQGTAADLIKIAMLAVDKRLKDERKEGYMVLQIHDELLLEVPDSEVESISKLVKEEMERAFTLSVPLVVDVSVGKNWMEC